MRTPVRTLASLSYEGYTIAVPTHGVLCDICTTGIEHFIEIYRQAYDKEPTTLLYSRVDRSHIHALRWGDLSSDMIRTTIRYWVELPLNSDMWGVAGDEGLVLSEGA